MSAGFLRGFAARLGRDRSGLALIEFGYALPVLLGVGLYAVETANLALANLRISQIALNLADNASRVGAAQANNTSQLREIDINDVMTAARIQGKTWDLTGRGRITLSSLEEKGGKQTIHWQRCLGTKSGAGYDSSYGTTSATAGTDTSASNSGTVVSGMGDPGAEVTAPPDSGVMFVEINYLYKPVVSSGWLVNGSEKIRFIASFVVRDRRVFDQIYNPSPSATRMTCNLHTA